MKQTPVIVFQTIQSTCKEITLSVFPKDDAMPSMGIDSATLRLQALTS